MWEQLQYYVYEQCQHSNLIHSASATYKGPTVCHQECTCRKVQQDHPKTMNRWQWTCRQRLCSRWSALALEWRKRQNNHTHTYSHRCLHWTGILKMLLIHIQLTIATILKSDHFAIQGFSWFLVDLRKIICQKNYWVKYRCTLCC